MIIAGGGIAGLCAAIACEQRGIVADVFEREPVLQPVGAGLCLWHNAMLALKNLGLDTQLAPVSTPFFVQENRTSEGAVLESHSFAEMGRSLGVDALTVHRGDLHEVLIRNMRPDRLHLGRRCTGYDANGDRIVVHFEGQPDEECDCLVGAEGIWSVVRAKVRGEEPARYAGYTCYRGLVPYREEWFPEGWFIQSIGDGARMGVVHTGHDLVYWWATVNAPEHAPEPSGGRKQALLDRFAGWAYPTPQIFEATDDAAILLNDIVDRPPIDDWGAGPVTLAGDAAHPMTPNMAQGACQAIEDGVVLATRLANSESVGEALRGYEDARRQRTAVVVNQSWLIGARGQGLLPPEEANRAISVADRERLLRFDPDAQP